MEMAAIAYTISRQRVQDDDVEQPSSDWRLAPQAVNPVPMIAEKLVLVCFPVLLPGEYGRVIPFGRYDLARAHQSASPGAASQKAMLVSRDNGARIVLSTQELNALAQDPDVEII